MESLFWGFFGVAAPLLKKGALYTLSTLHWENQESSHMMWNCHKITWEIIKGIAIKESVTFHQEQLREEELPGKKNKKIYALNYASDSLTAV